MRAEYPISAFGSRVVALFRAVMGLSGRPDESTFAYEPWTPLSLPAEAPGFDGQPTFMFSAICRYQGAQPGAVLLIVTEEQMRQAAPPFQQCHIAFIDCAHEPPPSLNPLELFDPYARRQFVREPMWSAAPADQLAREALEAMRYAWSRLPGPVPALK
jgi:hypothetical protein